MIFVFSDLLDRGGELVRGREIERNIASAVEKLSLCLPVMKMYSKLKNQVENKRF